MPRTQNSGQARLTPDIVKKLLIKVEVPTATGFTRLYNRIHRERPDDAERVARACRAIIATTKMPSSL